MVYLSYFFIIILSIFDLAVWSCPCPYTGYCSLPCPFMCPAPSPWQPGRPNMMARGSFPEYGDEEPTTIKNRHTDPDDPPPKPKPKPKPEENEPEHKKKTPGLQPSRRFFTSLFSIPGAVVDTVLGGEIVL